MTNLYLFIYLFIFIFFYLFFVCVCMCVRRGRVVTVNSPDDEGVCYASNVLLPMI